MFSQAVIHSRLTYVLLVYTYNISPISGSRALVFVLLSGPGIPADTMCTRQLQTKKIVDVVSRHSHRLLSVTPDTQVEYPSIQPQNGPYAAET